MAIQPNTEVVGTEEKTYTFLLSLLPSSFLPDQTFTDTYYVLYIKLRDGIYYEQSILWSCCHQETNTLVEKTSLISNHGGKRALLHVYIMNRPDPD